MNSKCYIFSGDDEAFLFFDIIVWAICRYYGYSQMQTVDSINHFYANNTSLWEDYWYEHEGYSQMICGVLYENEAKGKYRDSNFTAFANKIRSEYASMFSSLGNRRMNLIGNIDMYPSSQLIEIRLNCIENSLG